MRYGSAFLLAVLGVSIVPGGLPQAPLGLAGNAGFPAGIFDAALRDVSCARDIYDLLDVGKGGILYVHFNNLRKPVVLGIGYPQEGRGFVVPLMAAIANAIMSLFLYPILSIIGGYPQPLASVRSLRSA